MAGAEIAALLWPFIKAAAAVLVLWGAWRGLKHLIASGAVNKHQKEALVDAAERRKKTDLDLRKERAVSRSAFRRGWNRVRGKDGDLPPRPPT